MSSDKVKRAKRRKNTAVMVARQVRIYKGANWNIETKPVPGKYRKHRALNCGTPHCNMCGNPRHVWGYVTIAERRANEAMHQTIKDIQ